MRSHPFVLVLVVGVVLGTAGCSTRRDRDRPRDGGPIEPPFGDSSVPPGRDGGEPPGRDGGGTECPPGYSLCDGDCVDTGNDDNNCGGCFVVCMEGSFCSDASCVPIGPSCPPPRQMCGEACVDTLTNPAHCGACFEACPGGSVCSSGECTSICVPDCSEAECGSDGCGGSCGTCPGGTTCLGGLCEPTCAGGLTLCSGTCIDTRTSPTNCGGCGIVCGAGSSCVLGTCSPVTPPGSGEACSSALLFPAAGGSQTFTFTGRVANHTPFTCGATTATPDVAYRWTPSRSGTAVFAAAGPTSDVDVMLSVFSASTCTSSSSLGCNDDEASGVYSSRLSLAVTAGATYYVVVGSYSSPAPTSTITLRITSP